MNKNNEVAQKIGKYRWVIVALLLFSTTFNYLDRQVLSYLKPYFCSQEGFGWTNTEFSTLVAFFTGFYGMMTIFIGVVIDKIGTKLGLAMSLIIWSIFGMANALVGSVLWLHIAVRSLFGVGEAGNFPASIKTVAEWFPKKERALATSIFNSGSNLGAMIAALFVPWCMAFFGDGTGAWLGESNNGCLRLHRVQPSGKATYQDLSTSWGFSTETSADLCKRFVNIVAEIRPVS